MGLGLVMEAAAEGWGLAVVQGWGSAAEAAAGAGSATAVQGLAAAAATADLVTDWEAAQGWETAAAGAAQQCTGRSGGRWATTTWVRLCTCPARSGHSSKPLWDLHTRWAHTPQSRAACCLGLCMQSARQHTLEHSAWPLRLWATPTTPQRLPGCR